MTDEPTTAATAKAAKRLIDNVSKYPGLLVAFSAGVDSAVVLAAASRAGIEVLALTAVSDSLPQAEGLSAASSAKDLGVRHIFAQTHEMGRDGYRDNSGNRCYFCKAELVEVATEYLTMLPTGSRVATGTNADDRVAGFRPGIRAAAERNAVTPLADVGLAKHQVRAIARFWGLPVWDKPQAACLSSRIAYGLQITPDNLARVERAETAVRSSLARRSVPARNVRVRDMGRDQARIEVDNDALLDDSWFDDVRTAVRDAGFESAEIDPRGFRSGSLNELLIAPTARSGADAGN